MLARMHPWIALMVSLASPAVAHGDAAVSDTLRLDIPAAIELALRQGVQADLARQEVATARAQVGVARSYALPDIDLHATYDRNLEKPAFFFPVGDGTFETLRLGDDNQYGATLTVRQPLFSSGRFGSAMAAARHGLAAASKSADAQASSIVLQVKGAYLRTLLSREQVRISRLSLAQAQRNEALVHSHVARGMRPRFDEIRAQVEVANRRPVVTQASNDADVALESLKELLGVALDQPVALVDSLSYNPVTLTRDAAVQEALAQRRDLQAATERLAQLRHRERAQDAQDRPELYLDGTYFWQAQDHGGLWGANRVSAAQSAVGLSLTWPILDGLENRYRTQQAEAAVRRAELELRHTRDQVELAARASWARVQALKEELQGADEAVALAKEAYRLAQVRYDNGASTQLEVFDAELALTRARLARAQTLYAYDLADAQLEADMGHGPHLAVDSQGP